MTLTIERPREAWCCSQCGGRHVHAKGGVTREFRTLPIGGKPVRLRMTVPRVLCRTCFVDRQVTIGFADPKKSYTRSFARYVVELARMMTLADVARHLQISWDVVKGIVGDDLERRFAQPKLRSLRRIAIDEIHLGKKHKYLTIVMDLDRGAIVFVGDGKGESSLEPFWRRLRHSRAKIAAVAADLSPAYSAAIRRNLPRADLVFDRFHLVKLLNEHLTELRRELHREATDQLHKQVLKGTRWLLLKRSADLDPKRDERRRLKEALQLNESLATAYYLKEDLATPMTGRVWQQPGKASARIVLDHWIAAAESSGIRQLMKFARTLQTHREGILNWYDHPISTGPLEGTNNKIKLLQRQAYGYRDLPFFKLKLLALHNAQHALIG
jgi:transposase